MPSAFPVGHRSTIRPIPPVPECTTWFDSDTVRIGVEYRVLNAAVLSENFDAASADAAMVAEVQPDGGFDDEGLSFHVVDASDGTERIRIDVFDDDPHYHYLLTPDEHIMVTYDASAHGDMLEWALVALRHRLPDMLRFAGADALASRVDLDQLAPVLDRVAHAARNAKGELAPLARQRLAEAAERPGAPAVR